MAPATQNDLSIANPKGKTVSRNKRFDTFENSGQIHQIRHILRRRLRARATRMSECLMSRVTQNEGPTLQEGRISLCLPLKSLTAPSRHNTRHAGENAPQQERTRMRPPSIHQAFAPTVRIASVTHCCWEK